MQRSARSWQADQNPKLRDYIDLQFLGEIANLAQPTSSKDLVS